MSTDSIKQIAPEIDALRQGMGWDTEDIGRKQILIDSTYGDSHPGSVHLDRLAEAAADGVKYSGAKPAHYTVTDMCDGIAQGHAGMNYSLVSREIIAGMTEIHARASAFDGMVVLSGCDKSVPAHLMAMARLNLPSIHVPGGVMPAAGGGFTLEQIGNVSARLRKGEITEEQFTHCQRDACPSCGACQFMGTAATMQVLSEALGLALPHSALAPANLKFIDNLAKAAGKAVVRLVENNIRVSDILTEKAFYNAVVIHGAIGGSTNALLHLPAIAHELRQMFDMDLVDRVHREVPFLADTRPVGKYTTEMLWYAGGVPRLMMLLKEHLHLDVMTVTGRTLGENLEDMQSVLPTYEAYLQNYGLKVSDVVHPISSHGAIAVLHGNIAPDGAVVKYTGLPQNMQLFEGRARVFDDELSARDAILEKRIRPGDCIVIRYAGPKGSGMPEMFYTTEALCADPTLVATTAILTDGRFSGASKGPCIGHISPEAAEGGAIALVEEGDRIRIDIPNRRIDLVGVDMESRRDAWERVPRNARQKDPGILGVYKTLAVSAMKGGYMDV